MKVIWKKAQMKQTGQIVDAPFLVLTEKEYMKHWEEYAGFCFKCGDVQEDGVEPDARAYRCYACNENKVYGAQYGVLFNRIIVDNGDDK